MNSGFCFIDQARGPVPTGRSMVHFIMRPKWHGRDNPLWLSCIRIGTGREGMSGERLSYTA